MVAKYPLLHDPRTFAIALVYGSKNQGQSAWTCSTSDVEYCVIQNHLAQCVCTSLVQSTPAVMLNSGTNIPLSPTKLHITSPFLRRHI